MHPPCGTTPFLPFPHPPSSLAWAFKRFPPVFSFFVYLLPAPTQPSPQCRECMGERATPVCAWFALAPPRRNPIFVCLQNAPPSVVLFCSFVFTHTHTPPPGSFRWSQVLSQ
eukprot:TRINITY_DN6564_c0_g1_i1.p4 TRINITY_DN6564_c0_g1~~TRINITY_DN6564_c0_g1_i1.p4  ORF type:complete len:112 (-),score=9.47 TRINITY_DN6564_c0_g1_i1:109-444(-)